MTRSRASPPRGSRRLASIFSVNLMSSGRGRPWRVARLMTELEASREIGGGAERAGHGAGHGAEGDADVRAGRDFEDDGDERAESAGALSSRPAA